MEVLRCPDGACGARIIAREKLKTPTTAELGVWQASGVSLTEGLFLVTDVFDFDNVAVSRGLNSPESPREGDVRLLCCAECNQGPIGYALPQSSLYLVDSTKLQASS